MSFARLAALALIAVGLSVAAAGVLAQTAAAASAPTPGAEPGRSVRRGGDAGAKTIVFSKGTANWDSAFDTLVEAFK